MINLEIFIAARAQVFIVNIGDEYLENPPRAVSVPHL
jgi:hypothetical protein